jgi:hypothetical protein
MSFVLIQYTIELSYGYHAIDFARVTLCPGLVDRTETE